LKPVIEPAAPVIVVWSPVFVPLDDPLKFDAEIAPLTVNFPVLALNDNLLAVVLGVVADPTADTITG
jgi:hypothetical protein